MTTDFNIAPAVIVNISRETLFPQGAGFSTLAVHGAGGVIDYRERIRFYQDITEVGDDFTAGVDEEYAAALAWFSQSPRPTLLAITTILSTSPAGFVRGGTPAALAVWQGITDGEFSITMNAQTEELTALNTSAATSLADVATTIQTALQLIGGAEYATSTCAYDAIRGVFIITSGNTGVDATVSALSTIAVPVGTDISGAGGLNMQAAIAIIGTPYDYASLSDELDRVEDASTDWYGHILVESLRSDANYLEAAAWTEARVKLMGAIDSTAAGKDAGSSADLLAQLKLASYQRTFAVWHSKTDDYPDAAAFGIMLTTDFNGTDTMKTLKFKTLVGVATQALTSTELAAIKGKNANAYISRGGLPSFEEGMQAGGEFFDVMQGVDWLQDAISVGVYGELKVTATKIPYTDEGAAQLEDAVRQSLNQAVQNGLIASVADEDTGDVTPAFVLTTPLVASVPPSQRGNRIAPSITFVATLAGAIHFAVINGTVTV